MDRKQISAHGHILVSHPLLTQWCSQWCNRALAYGGRMNRASYKDILRYVLDSEECKIDATKARNLKTLVEHLCTTVNDEFMKYYLMVVVLYRLPHFRSVPISNYFKFQTADISIRYQLLQTYNKTHKIVRFWQIYCKDLV